MTWRRCPPHFRGPRICWNAHDQQPPSLSEIYVTLSFDSQIAARLDHAEDDVRCLFPRSRNDGRRLAHRSQSGSVVRVQPGYFARASYWKGLNVRQRFAHVLRASAEQHPLSVFTGFAAAFILGLDLPRARLGYVRKRDCVAACEHGDYIYVNGYRVSPLHETLFDCMVDMSFPEGLAFVDSAFRGYPGLGKEPLLEYFRRRETRSSGFRRAMSALALGDGACPHPDLSFARGGIYEQGFTMPDFADGLPADFCWTREDGTILYANLVGRSDRYEHVAAPERASADRSGSSTTALRLTPDIIDDTVQLSRVLAQAGVPHRD